jgi:hypothetical protein
MDKIVECVDDLKNLYLPVCGIQFSVFKIFGVRTLEKTTSCNVHGSYQVGGGVGSSCLGRVV